MGHNIIIIQLPVAHLSGRLVSVIFQNDKGRAIWFTRSLACSVTGYIEVISQDNIFPTVAIQVSAIHSHPAPPGQFRKSIGLKAEIAFIFQKEKAFFRMSPVVSKKRNGCDIKITIAVKIPRHCLVTPIDGKEPTLCKIIFSVIDENVNTMIRFQYRGKISIVSAGVQYIRITVFVKIIQFKR